MVDEHTIELLLYPADFAIHHVYAEAALRIDPFIPGLPEIVSNLNPLGSRRKSTALLQRQWVCNVNIEIDVRLIVPFSRCARSRQHNRLHRREFLEPSRNL